MALPPPVPLNSGQATALGATLCLFVELLRGAIPPPTPASLREDTQRACETLRAHGKGGTFRSVDWLLTAARLLLRLKEGWLSSKSEAAAWGAAHAQGAWRAQLARAAALRHNPALATMEETQR